MSNKPNDKNTFIRIPDELLLNYDYKHLILLSKIATLAFTSGYCSASNERFFEDLHKLTINKLNKSLDWLEDNGLIIRYNQLKMVNNDFLRTKRLIVLSDYSYKVFQSINSNSSNKMHKPIECPKGFLIHDEFLKRTKRKNKATKQNAPVRDAKLSSKQTEHLNPFSDDVNNNASEDLKQQEQPQNEHIKQSKDDASSMNVFLNNQGIKTKNDGSMHPKRDKNKQAIINAKRNELFLKFCTYYQQKGYDDYTQRAKDKLEKLEQQAINSKG